MASAANAEVPQAIIEPGPQGIESIDLSPDGQRLVWLSGNETGNRIYLRPLRGGKAIELPMLKGVKAPLWAGDNRHIYALSDPTGDELMHLFVFDADAPEKDPVDVTPYPGKKALLVDVSSPDGSALVALNLERDADFGLYRAKPSGGPPRPVEKAVRGRQGWMVSDDGELFGGLTVDGPVNRLDFQRPGTHKRQSMVLPGNGRWPGEGLAWSGSPMADGSVWLLARGESDSATLQRLDLATGKVTEAIPNSWGVDVDMEVVDRDGRPLAVQTEADYPVLHFFDKPLASLLKGVPLPLHTLLREVSYDRDRGHLLFLFTTDLGEEDLVFVDRAADLATVIYHRAPPLPEIALPRTVPVTITARDGVPLHAYLTLPPNGPASPLPLVLFVHGGPWARDNWDFDPVVVALTLSGHAVLRVNYRGSGGYGRTFEAAGLGEWGGRMQDDLTDATCWAVRNHVADANRMAIVGASYGGYAAAEALVRTPKLFAAAVSVDGPYDLPAMVDEARPYAVDYDVIIGEFVGDRAVQWDRSPLAHVDAIERPILAFQGINDPRIRVTQLQKFEQAMRQAGKPIETVYLPGEGHGISNANFQPYLKKVIEFLKTNLHDTPPLSADLSYCH